MSRGPHVLDMEYREPYWLELGPRGPIFSSTPPIYQQQQHPSHRPGSEVAMGLAPWGSPSIMVCVTLILKTFEYVRWILFCFMMFAWKLWSLTCPYLGRMTRCSSKLVPLGMSLHWVGLWKVIIHSFHTYHFSSLSLSSIPYIGSGIGFAKLVRVVPCLVGRKG